MPWKHVGDARLHRSLHQDRLLIDCGDEDRQYSLSIHAARDLVEHGHQTSLYQRYPSSSNPCAREGGSGGVQIRRSRSGLALTFAVDGRLYAINRSRLTEVLNDVTIAARVVERITDAGQLSDSAGRQATLGAF